MSKVVSIHEYTLKPDADARAFEKAISGARRRGLLYLPGLVDIHFVRGIRGARRGRYADLLGLDRRLDAGARCRGDS